MWSQDYILLHKPQLLISSINSWKHQLLGTSRAHLLAIPKWSNHMIFEKVLRVSVLLPEQRLKQKLLQGKPNAYFQRALALIQHLRLSTHEIHFELFKMWMCGRKGNSMSFRTEFCQEIGKELKRLLKNKQTSPSYPIRFWIEVHCLLQRLTSKSLSNKLTELTSHSWAWTAQNHWSEEAEKPHPGLTSLSWQACHRLLHSRGHSSMCSQRGCQQQGCSWLWPADSVLFFLQLPGLASHCLGRAEQNPKCFSRWTLVHVYLWILEGRSGARFQGDLYAAY